MKTKLKNELYNSVCLTHDTITTLGFKNNLISNYPDYYWTLQEVEDFLSNKDLIYRTDGGIRTYILQDVYYSQSKGCHILISDMDRVHIYNALNLNYRGMTVLELITNQNSEAFKLLKGLINENIL